MYTYTHRVFSLYFIGKEKAMPLSTASNRKLLGGIVFNTNIWEELSAIYNVVITLQCSKC